MAGSQPSTAQENLNTPALQSVATSTSTACTGITGAQLEKCPKDINFSKGETKPKTNRKNHTSSSTNQSILDKMIPQKRFKAGMIQRTQQEMRSESASEND
jgi:hypothetical protein